MLPFAFSRRSRRIIFAVAYVAMLTISGCAHQPVPSASEPPGFVGSLFTDVRIYAFPNSGGRYDFGYLIGAAIFLGGVKSAGRIRHGEHSEQTVSRPAGRYAGYSDEDDY